MIEPSAFMDSRLKGAHKLLHATHDYVKWQAPLEIQHMDAEHAFKVSCEAMRVTTRLTQVIAWLLLQKAVLAGELPREEMLSDECRVLRGTFCLEKVSETDKDFSPRLRELLKESRELYVRVVRLDERARHHQISPFS